MVSLATALGPERLAIRLLLLIFESPQQRKKPVISSSTGAAEVEVAIAVKHLLNHTGAVVHQLLAHGVFEVALLTHRCAVIQRQQTLHWNQNSPGYQRWLVNANDLSLIVKGWTAAHARVQ